MILKDLRNERGWTQEHLASLIKVDRTTITKIENGHSPSIPTAKALGKVFGIPWHSFYTEESEKPA